MVYLLSHLFHNTDFLSPERNAAALRCNGRSANANFFQNSLYQLYQKRMSLDKLHNSPSTENPKNLGQNNNYTNSKHHNYKRIKNT